MAALLARCLNRLSLLWELLLKALWVVINIFVQGMIYKEIFLSFMNYFMISTLLPKIFKYL